MNQSSNHMAKIGDTVVMSEDFLNAYTNRIAQVATEKALEIYSIEKSKEEKLTVIDIAKQEKCSPPTVLEWIKRGVKKGKIKLKASRKGKRDYVITRYDLNEFLAMKKQQ